tara:strand:+ start:201 stop:365 length:165 start_codon:yes stop_codon:yes gene_type:complete
MGRARDDMNWEQNDDMRDDWEQSNPETRDPRGPKQIGKRIYDTDKWNYQGDFDD